MPPWNWEFVLSTFVFLSGCDPQKLSGHKWNGTVWTFDIGGLHVQWGRGKWIAAFYCVPIWWNPYVCDRGPASSLRSVTVVCPALSTGNIKPNVFTAPIQPVKLPDKGSLIYAVYLCGFCHEPGTWNGMVYYGKAVVWMVSHLPPPSSHMVPASEGCGYTFMSAHTHTLAYRFPTQYLMFPHPAVLYTLRDRHTTKQKQTCVFCFFSGMTSLWTKSPLSSSSLCRPICHLALPWPWTFKPNPDCLACSESPFPKGDFISSS